jgi:carboxyl-terminal processing protease
MMMLLSAIGADPLSRFGRSMTRKRRLPTIALVPLALLAATGTARADNVIDEAVRLINQHHLLHPDPASLDRDTRAGLLASLHRIDAGAQWWPPEMASAIKDWTGQDVVGIGASVIDDGSRILFVPLPGGSMAHEGFDRPVRLVSLQGRAADKLDLESVQQVLGDPANVRIEVMVDGLAGEPPAHLVLERRPYDPVSAERIDHYARPIVRIHRFIKDLTSSQLRSAVLPMLKAGQPIILDLRYSTGGDLYEALNSASLFLPPGLKLATLENDTGRRTVFHSVDTDTGATSGNIFILVSRGTISAAEVFAAALHHHAQARLIGTPTYGKCIAQSAFPLIDGSVLVLSTERIRTATDWYCDGKGLDPDIRVDPAASDDTDALIARYVR